MKRIEVDLNARDEFGRARLSVWCARRSIMEHGGVQNGERVVIVDRNDEPEGPPIEIRAVIHIEEGGIFAAPEGDVMPTKSPFRTVKVAKMMWRPSEDRALLGFDEILNEDLQHTLKDGETVWLDNGASRVLARVAFEDLLDGFYAYPDWDTFVRYSTEDVKHIDPAEFVELGYLQEANRQFFHPVGLALEYAQRPDGVVVLSGVQDHRDLPAGYTFDPPMSQEHREERRRKLHLVQQEIDSRVPARLKTIGSVIQYQDFLGSDANDAAPRAHRVLTLVVHMTEDGEPGFDGTHRVSLQRIGEPGSSVELATFSDRDNGYAYARRVAEFLYRGSVVES